MSRRLLLLVLGLVVGCTSAPDVGESHRLLVLGFDGVDPRLLERFMAAGELPNFARLAKEGSYRPLGTTIPPQSPVAWSTFITGLDPGGTGIYDFVHRDPAPPGGGAVLPFLSTSRAEEDESRLTMFRYALPLGSGKVELLRHGKAFWNVLGDHGVPATVLKIPANFPPEPSSAHTLSDMGTPDLRGTYGTFSYFSSDPSDGGNRSVSGGLFHRVSVSANHASAALPGPTNPFYAEHTRATAPFEVDVDPASDAAVIEVGGERILLQVGEWSDWVQVQFTLVPAFASVHGIVRFHLAQVRPYLRLYTSPVNIDPANPALPISTPPEYAADLAANAGDFYTQGLPENTAALTANVLDDTQWLGHADSIYAERMRLFELELARFRGGLLFAYFGGVDLVSHMFWRTLDREQDGQPVAHADAILNAYRQLDATLGRAVAAIVPAGKTLQDTDTTLIVMSDHGFAPFARSVEINSWLRSEGFLALRPGAETGRELYVDVDWAKTRAYGLGLNGLYLNQAGRERFGIVHPGERDALVADLTQRLLAWRDPATGERPVSKVYRREDVYSAEYRELAPDLIVGYRRGYRISNASALGEVPAMLIEDNTKKWSGDHCIAADEVPGVLLTNRRLTPGAASLLDLAPTILTDLGVPVPGIMHGRPLLAP